MVCWGWAATVAMVGSNALMIVTAGLVFVKPFLGRRQAADSVSTRLRSACGWGPWCCRRSAWSGAVQRGAGAAVRGPVAASLAGAPDDVMSISGAASRCRWP